MTVLIIGGNGFIGSHVNKYFVKNGVDTIILDNFSRSKRLNLPLQKFIEGDFGDRNRLEMIFTSHSIDLVMHFGAFAYVGESMENPQIYYENNVIKFKMLLDVMLEHKIDKIVFSSSCATYGEAKYLPIDESHPQNPLSPYGRTKLIDEWLLKDYEMAYGLKYCILRYFNAAGADPEGELGENHEPETHLIPRILLHLIGKYPSITIYGNDYPTDDGTCVRDYIHVWDLAQAHYLASLFLLSNGSSNNFNLGNDLGVSNLEIVRICEEITQKTCEIKFQVRRPGDPAVVIGSSKKAKEILGWNPIYQDIRDMIRHSWNYFLKRY